MFFPHGFKTEFFFPDIFFFFVFFELHNSGNKTSWYIFFHSVSLLKKENPEIKKVYFAQFDIQKKMWIQLFYPLKNVFTFFTSEKMLIVVVLLILYLENFFFTPDKNTWKMLFH